MIKAATDLNCDLISCLALVSMDIIRYSCIVCGKKKDEPYYVVYGAPCVCQECGKKAIELKPRTRDI